MKWTCSSSVGQKCDKGLDISENETLDKYEGIFF